MTFEEQIAIDNETLFNSELAEKCLYGEEKTEIRCFFKHLGTDSKNEYGGRGQSERAEIQVLESDITPKKNDTLIYGEKTWRVVRSPVLEYGVYTCELQKGSIT